MATRTVTSNSITFIDTSDERKLEVSVEANLPTSQIYNSNTGVYSPDWTTNNLVLEACATLDLIDITQDEGITITWSKKIGTGEAQSAGTGYQLKISTNELSDASGIVTYICTAIYDGLTATSQMTFTRVDTGNNGRGIKSVVNYYLASSLSSGVTRTNTAGWSTQIPTLTETNKYLWNYEEIQYSDNNFDYTEPCIVGNFATNGKAGKGISSIEEYYAISDSNSTSPDDSEFSTTVPTLTSINKYLWNYEKITYTDKTNYTSEKRVIGVYGDSAIVYSMSVSTNVISKNTSNQYNPSAIKLEGKQKVGNNLLSNYSGRFKIEETTDMSSWASKYTSSKDESATEYVPSVGIKAIKCSMYQAGESGDLLDYQIIPIVSDGSDSYTIILSNESHTFAGSESSAIVGNTTCEVIAYKGTERVAATIGTISGCPTGMTTSISNNSTASANFTVSVDTTMTTKSGMLTIPITVDEKSFTKYFSYSLALNGSDGVNGITFQIYGEQGFVLTKDSPETTLKVLAYDGGVAITDATYEWSYRGNTNTDDESADVVDWINTNVTTDSITVDRTQVFKSTSYQCKMHYNNKDYYSSVVVQDTNDIYDAIVNISDTIKTIDGKCYWVLFTTVYSENGEMDPLKGEIRSIAPGYTWIKYADDKDGFNMSDEPTGKEYIGLAYNKNTSTESNNVDDYIWEKFSEDFSLPDTNIPDYYYHINLDNKSVTLKHKHEDASGNLIWDDVEENYQEYSYWNSLDDNNQNLYNNKVKIISSDDFTGTKTFVFGVTYEGELQARTSITLTDTSDPIISQNEPKYAQNGQVWIKQDDNTGDYLIMVYTSDGQGGGSWVNVSQKRQIYTKRPNTYNEGDLWVTNSDDDYFKTCTWIKYADDASGTNISDEPTNKSYIGIALNKTTKIESENPNDYSWSTINSSDGILNNGTYTWIKYSDNITDDVISVEDSPINSDGTIKKYIGIAYDKITSEKSTDASDYIWSEFDGNNGVINGSQTYLKGTLLVAKSSRNTYDGSDWKTSYDIDRIQKIETDMANLTNHVKTTRSGIEITATDENNNPSPFSSHFDANSLSFKYEGNSKLEITTDGISTPNIEVENEFRLNRLCLIEESNGSYSFVIR